MSRVKRALQMTVFMSLPYVLSQQRNVKADAYCDGYIAGCEAALADSCEGTWSIGCSDTDHSIKHCDCS